MSRAEGEKKEKTAKRDPEGARKNILRVASQAFAETGLSGTRIDEIAAQTKTSKRMIYYYFGDKAGLYKTCLEAAYEKVRKGEEELDLGGLAPAEALARLVNFTFDHHRKNPEFIRMVMIENIHNANYLRQSELVKTMNSSAIEKLTEIIKRGQDDGIFRNDLDPIQLHWQISALSFFNVSNRHTFSALFGNSLFSRSGQEQLRMGTTEMVLSYACNRKDPQNDQP